MGTVSYAHWFILLIAAAAVAIPAARVLKRVGMSPWWAIFYVVPLVGWVCLWVFAFSRWPIDSKPDAA